MTPDMIAARQELDMRPQLERLDRLILHAALQGVADQASAHRAGLDEFTRAVLNADRRGRTAATSSGRARAAPVSDGRHTKSE